MARKKTPTRVREPIQIYMDSDERRLLDRMAAQIEVSRAEVLRRGLRSFAREQSPETSPMLAFMHDMTGADWPADIGRDHDAYLEEAQLDTHEPAATHTKRKRKR